jgi:threonine dehydrogenase-like Zn-dependent dehydrogenase
MFLADGGQMQALTYNGSDVEFCTTYPLPVPQTGESLVQVELATICNTDREIMRGYRPDFRGILGHEFVGVVRESDEATLVGKQVVGEINLSCQACLYCTTGRPHHCANRRTLGINHKDGTFADYLTLPTELLHVVQDDLPIERAVFCEPLAAALRITEQLDFSPALPVAIVGDGRLALMICQALAATTEARLTVIGHHPEKLTLFAAYARTLTEPLGDYEVVIDATGSPTSLASSIALTRSEGTLVIKSTYAGLAEIDISEIVVRELRIQGSRCGPFEPALQLLAEGKIDLPPLELFALSDYRAAFASAAFKAAFDFRK